METSLARSNLIQSCLLYDQAEPIALVALIQAFLKAERNAHGYEYRVMNGNGQRLDMDDESLFVQLVGGANDDVVITVEWANQPANPRALAGSLASAYTTMVTAPDALARLTRHRGHLLIGAQHGVIPDIPELRSLLGQLNMPAPGDSLEQFRERLRVLETLTALAIEISRPTLVHWTSSGVLAQPDSLVFAQLDAGPSPLNVHPLPFSVETPADQRGVAGFTTIGAANFVGREISVRPSVVPWIEVYQHVLGFLKIAIDPKGYVIPDGHTMGDESGTFCYRVRHPSEPVMIGGVERLVYEFEPLLNVRCGFRDPSYIDRGAPIDVDKPELTRFGVSKTDGKAMVQAWREQRANVERIGGRFEVRARNEPAPTPPRSWFSRLLGR